MNHESVLALHSRKTREQLGQIGWTCTLLRLADQPKQNEAHCANVYQAASSTGIDSSDRVLDSLPESIVGERSIVNPLVLKRGRVEEACCSNGCDPDQVVWGSQADTV